MNDLRKSVATGAALACAVVAALVLPAAAPGLTKSSDESGLSPGEASLRVGHSVEHLVVPGSLPGELRNVEVHFWYPADRSGFPTTPKTSYASTLNGLPLLPTWDALSWTIDARVAREAPIDPRGGPFPLIVFSHGNQNDPIDYAYTLELIAAAGFVVAAPAHTSNTGDDLRRDFVNKRAGTQLLQCADGLPAPQAGLLSTCSKTNVARSMADRVRDIRAVVDAVPGWYGESVDMSRVGVFGHSRGTVTALAAAGGSATWGTVPVAGIKAVMGMAIGNAAITAGVNFKGVLVPTLLVGGELDVTSPPGVSESAVAQISSTDKDFVLIKKAVHRSFDSTYCAQMQAAGSVVLAKGDPAQLDRHTLTGDLATPPPLGILTHTSSGVATDYCSYAAFTEPVDITSLVQSITTKTVTAENVPATGLDTEEVRSQVTELAVTFFRRVLTCAGGDGPRRVCKD